jgi:excinuclease ABC subunit C
VMRDRIQRLESLREQFGRIRFALESLTFVYTVPGATPAETRAYVVRRGRVREEVAAPHTAAARRKLEARVSEILAPTERAAATVPGHEVDEVLLVASWFRHHPKELERTTPFGPAESVRSA